MTRELCIVCGVAYVDSSGRCPNGCTDKISRDLKKALQGDQDALKRLEDLKPGIQKSKAHTWGLQHGFKPKRTNLVVAAELGVVTATTTLAAAVISARTVARRM